MNIKQHGKIGDEHSTRQRNMSKHQRSRQAKKTPDGKEGEICMMVQIQSFAQRSTVARLLER